MTPRFDVIVCGGGLAGTSAALAVARSGLKAALIAPPLPSADGRTTALMMPSVRFLDELGLWQTISETASPLRVMRIIDDTDRLLRSPPLTFRAQEIGEEAFGYNISNAPLLQIIMQSTRNESGVSIFETAAESIALQGDCVTVILADGTKLEGDLIAGADGRNSLTRSAAGIPIRSWSYPQTALVLNFEHQYDHADTSNEFHTPSGPFTQVPLGPKRSSLVWAMKPADADQMKDRPDEALANEIERQSHSILGKVTIVSGRHFFPFSGLIASRFGSGRTVLLGESGHVFPPIGAQGFNLGLRDVSRFVEVLRQAGPDNAETITRRYDRLRLADIRSRTMGVDLLNRSLLNRFLPVQMARYAGMMALAHIPPLRTLAMREGMEPGHPRDLFKRPGLHGRV